MKSASVVNLPYEMGKVFGHLLERFIGHRVGRFDLQHFHEALDLSIVIRVPSAAH